MTALLFTAVLLLPVVLIGVGCMVGGYRAERDQQRSAAEPDYLTEEDRAWLQRMRDLGGL